MLAWLVSCLSWLAPASGSAFACSGLTRRCGPPVWAPGLLWESRITLIEQVVVGLREQSLSPHPVPVHPCHVYLPIQSVIQGRPGDAKRFGAGKPGGTRARARLAMAIDQRPCLCAGCTSQLGEWFDKYPVSGTDGLATPESGRVVNNVATGPNFGFQGPHRDRRPSPRSTRWTSCALRAIRNIVPGGEFRW